MTLVHFHGLYGQPIKNIPSGTKGVRVSDGHLTIFTMTVRQDGVLANETADALGITPDRFQIEVERPEHERTAAYDLGSGEWLRPTGRDGALLRCQNPGTGVIIIRMRRISGGLVKVRVERIALEVERRGNRRTARINDRAAYEVTTTIAPTDNAEAVFMDLFGRISGTETFSRKLLREALEMYGVKPGTSTPKVEPPKVAPAPTPTPAGTPEPDATTEEVAAALATFYAETLKNDPRGRGVNPRLVGSVCADWLLEDACITADEFVRGGAVGQDYFEELQRRNIIRRRDDKKESKRPTPQAPMPRDPGTALFVALKERFPERSQESGGKGFPKWFTANMVRSGKSLNALLAEITTARNFDELWNRYRDRDSKPAPVRTVMAEALKSFRLLKDDDVLTQGIPDPGMEEQAAQETLLAILPPNPMGGDDDVLTEGIPDVELIPVPELTFAAPAPAPEPPAEAQAAVQPIAEFDCGTLRLPQWMVDAFASTYRSIAEVKAATGLTDGDIKNVGKAHKKTGKPASVKAMTDKGISGEIASVFAKLLCIS